MFAVLFAFGGVLVGGWFVVVVGIVGAFHGANGDAVVIRDEGIEVAILLPPSARRAMRSPGALGARRGAGRVIRGIVTVRWLGWVGHAVFLAYSRRGQVVDIEAVVGHAELVCLVLELLALVLLEVEEDHDAEGA